MDSMKIMLNKIQAMDTDQVSVNETAMLKTRLEEAKEAEGWRIFGQSQGEAECKGV